jgi:ribosomal protein S18 acetylase RimI-like enzyme
MRANEFITEVFEPGKTNWKWSRLGSAIASAFFKVGDREYLWQAFTGSNPKKWEIQFRLVRNPEVDSDNLDLYGKTGTGNSAQVLSTAVDITRAFIKEYGIDRVEEITFNAKEDSRIGLYAKMIQRLLPNWDLHQKYTKDNGMEYHLTDRRAYDKPENKLSEEAKAGKYNGLVMKYAFNQSALILKAFEQGTPIAFVKFVKENKELYPQNLWTHDDYRNRGVAKSMYDFLKSEGYIINRSHDQTKAGAGFWDKHRGEDEYVWEEEVLDESKIIDYEGIKLNVSVDGANVDIRALRPDGQQMGYVIFDRDGNTLVPDDLAVDDKYQGQGIAKIMYDYVKSLGFRIEASYDQTEAGKGFWKKHRGEERVWEDEKLDELFQPGKDWKWSFQGSEEAVAVFHVGKLPYMFHAYGADGQWEVEFKRHGNKLDRSQKFGLTGTGNSAEVMSTVVDIMRAFLDKYKDKIEVLIFSAKEDSRQGLYAKMVKRLLPNWIMRQDKEEFILIAPSEVKEEVLDEMPLPADWDPQQMRQQSTSFKSRLAYALERAKKLGVGSSRVATTIEYQGRPTVLKIAKNQKGLAQNSVEADILTDGYASQMGILIPIIDYDTQNREPSWVHTELAQKANEKQLCGLMKCQSLDDLIRAAQAQLNEYGTRSRDILNNIIDKNEHFGSSEQDADIFLEYVHRLSELKSSFDVELADFHRPANWGLSQAKPVIVDVGFNSNVMNQYYAR